MGVPTSEVGYTPAMSRREDHEVHKRTCGGIEKKIRLTQKSSSKRGGSNVNTNNKFYLLHVYNRIEFKRIINEVLQM
jgi:hypothetical protein